MKLTLIRKEKQNGGIVCDGQFDKLFFSAQFKNSEPAKILSVFKVINGKMRPVTKADIADLNSYFEKELSFELGVL